jgi:arginase family enzyme
MARPDALILDFDRAVLPLPNSTSVNLHAWQETIRFGCPLRSMQQLQADLAPWLPEPLSVAFTGSGDFHHVTCLLLERFRSLGKPVRIIVFDNHPDNMRYPFGIHCGSWVWHASRLPFVSGIDVLGITSRDVERPHAWENHWRNLRSGKVRYWCIGRDLDWMRWLGASHSRSFDSAAAMLAAYGEDAAGRSEALYISIDKDVLAREDAHTNWDQGVMRLTELLSALRALRPRVVAADVTGEVSVYRYTSQFKRLLSGLDGQAEISETNLSRWQAQHREINLQLLEVLSH